MDTYVNKDGHWVAVLLQRGRTERVTVESVSRELLRAIWTEAHKDAGSPEGFSVDEALALEMPTINFAITNRACSWLITRADYDGLVDLIPLLAKQSEVV